MFDDDENGELPNALVVPVLPNALVVFDVLPNAVDPNALPVDAAAGLSSLNAANALLLVPADDLFPNAPKGELKALVVVWEGEVEFPNALDREPNAENALEPVLLVELLLLLDPKP